jgi:limonene-1,2-epoxide hydrolase
MRFERLNLSITHNILSKQRQDDHRELPGVSASRGGERRAQILRFQMGPDFCDISVPTIATQTPAVFVEKRLLRAFKFPESQLWRITSVTTAFNVEIQLIGPAHVFFPSHSILCEISERKERADHGD